MSQFRWRKSRRSGGSQGNCVEISHNLAAVRDSKNPNGPILLADARALLAYVRADRSNAQ